VRLSGLEVATLSTLFPTNAQFVGEPFDAIPTVTVSEVTKIITQISAKSSPLDFVATSVIKSCVTVFADLIVRLANLSFSQGVFLSKYKPAIVTTLLKKPTGTLDDQNPTNFRPISNLNNIYKILEKLLLSRFQAHVCASDSFSSAQSAYRRHYPT